MVQTLEERAASLINGRSNRACAALAVSAVLLAALSCSDFAPSAANSNARLADLTISNGELVPAFDPSVRDYAIRLSLGISELSVGAVAEVPEGVFINIEEVATESGASSNVTLNLGDNLIEIVVTPEAGATETYRITASRGAGAVQQAFLQGSNTDAGDQFSFVALESGTLAVGASGEDSSSPTDPNDNSASAAGAVYVFSRNGDSWVEQAILKASNAEAADQFGQALALDGDTLVIGAPGEDSLAGQNDNSGTAAGAVYVFTRTSAVWSQRAYIKPADIATADRFGTAVALDGDTLAVGVPLRDSADLGGSGGVYIFVGSGSNWTQQAFLSSSKPTRADNFGAHVEVVADTLAVSVPGEDSDAEGIDGDAENDNRENSGAVFIYRRQETVWSPEAYLKASNPGERDAFGFSLALDADTVAIGADREASDARGVDGDQTSDALADAGAVYVFIRDGAQWSQQAYLKASNSDEGDRFGTSVAIEGDIIAVGAERETSLSTGVGSDETNNSAARAGAVYLFGRTVARWEQLAYVKPEAISGGDLFGQHVAVSGDTVAVGATGTSSGGSEDAPAAGAIVVFE